MPSAELLYEVTDGVARFTINRPERRNALSWGVVDTMSAAAWPMPRRTTRRAGGGPDRCRASRVLRRSGPRWDAWRWPRRAARRRGDSWRGSSTSCGHSESRRSHGCRGYCLAGGFGLALSCDLVVAADDAKFGTPEIKVGLWPYMITVPLCRSMPPKRALELMMTGRRIDAAEADRLGFLTSVVGARGARLERR